MISRIKGKLVCNDNGRAIIEVGGISYEVTVSASTASVLAQNNPDCVELVIYHYLSMDKSRAIPVMIGFIEDMEKDFFEKFIGVSGIGPRAAVKAFGKPIPLIAQAIEDGDVTFLQTLEGIGRQKSKQIIASLQGKVGRFALIKCAQDKKGPVKKEAVEEARQILKRLQYSAKEIEDMIGKALESVPDAESPESLLNEIYRQRR